jgi:polysaccharide export outer membrane protein
MLVLNFNYSFSYREVNANLLVFIVGVWAATALADSGGVTTSTSTNGEQTTNLMLSASGYIMDSKHRLEPGDVISFQIIEDKKPIINLQVTDSSELDVPYIGRVAVKGKTCQQLAVELKALLEQEYYYKATVIVGLNSVNRVRGQVFISGAVRSQGSLSIYFNHDLTAGEAILQAGGFNMYADKKAVKVVRNGGDGTDRKIFVINMVNVLEKGKIEEDVLLKPGDFIIVAERMIRL